MNENDFALVKRPSAAVEKAAPGAKRILSGMVADTLAFAKKKSLPQIIILDDNPYPLEFMELIIKKWFKNVVPQMFRDRNDGFQKLSQLNPDLLIVDTGMLDLIGRSEKSLQNFADKKVAYPIVVTSPFEDSIHIVNSYASKGLNITFLPKPFLEKTFIEILEASLKISRDTT